MIFGKLVVRSKLYIFTHFERDHYRVICFSGFPRETSGGNIFQASWDKLSDETQASKRAIELNNGRAAQMGILAMMVHEQLSNQPYIINDIVGASYTFN